MKPVFKIISMTLLVLFSSCKEKQSEDTKTFNNQMKETIKIHDDVMPKMSEINSMISKLEEEKEKLTKAEDVNVEEVQLYDQAISNLKGSHDLMMSWMKNFSNSFSRTEINKGLSTKDKDSIKAKLKNLDVQYKSAEQMRQAVNGALENAQMLLVK